ncbi:sugar transporter [Microdochium bolleyi]|uniref:Sugar transporter n=1 Tax=Microdochium bolleyi TaxID=196109 RepID=A0A136JCN7_9PEZI|nr:sugar transporter [Microdochium bolleyi]
MAGGTSLWVSADAKTDPKEIFNRRLLYLALTVALAGSFYGFDQGNIGGILTLDTFKQSFGFNGLSTIELSNRKGSIAAMLPAGASAGALLAWPTSDTLGRKWSVFLWGFVFLIGAIMQMISNYDVMLAGRFIGGLGVGASSMLSPQFLAENSPRSVRGSLTATYNLMIVTSIALAFWINYAVSLWKVDASDERQWKTSMAIQIIPAALMVIMIPFVPETPRYLINHGKSEQALKNLTKLRKLDADHPYVQVEYREMEAQVRYEQEARQGHGIWAILQDIFLDPSNRRRFFLAVMLFLFHKLTGTDALNYYAPSIFALIGVKGNSTTLLATGVYGIIKVVTMLFYVGYLVDRVGRRLPLLVGATIQATAMLYLGLYIRFAGVHASTSDGGTPAGGIVGIIAIYLYSFGWSFGHSVACYVVAAEIFPTRIRSVCMAFCFFVNWIVDYGITTATPHMLVTMAWGTFLLYAMLTYLGVVFIFFCLPEMKGRSLESMDDLFKRPLWTMWRHAYPTEEEKVRRDVQDDFVMDQGVKVQPTTAHVEKA